MNSGVSFCIRDVRSDDLLAEPSAAGWTNRCRREPSRQTRGRTACPVWKRGSARYDRSLVVVAGVSGAADDAAAAVAEAGLVAQVPAAGRHGALDERADEVHRQELAAELDHLRPADRRLQPLAVMEGGVPVVDRRVIAAERHLELIALVEPHDHALDFDVESRRRRRAGAGVGPRGEADLAEERDARRQLRRHVQHELAEAEALGRFRMLQPREIDVAESRQPKARELALAPGHLMRILRRRRGRVLGPGGPGDRQRSEDQSAQPGGLTQTFDHEVCAMVSKTSGHPLRRNREPDGRHDGVPHQPQGRTRARDVGERVGQLLHRVRQRFHFHGRTRDVLLRRINERVPDTAREGTSSVAFAGCDDTISVQDDGLPRSTNSVYSPARRSCRQRRARPRS